MDYYDDDGCSDSIEQFVVSVGDIYKYEEECQDLLLANEPAVHLSLVHDILCSWIEIYPDTLSEHFEEIPRTESGYAERGACYDEIKTIH